MPISPELYVSLLSALTVLFLGFLQWRSSARVQHSDAAERIGNAYDKLLENMQERISDLEKRLKKFEVWVPRLVAQVQELGGVPVGPPDTGEVWKPDKGREASL